MGAKLGDNIDSDLNLPCHEGMSSFEITNNISNHFSKISKEYEPLDVTSLSTEIQNKLSIDPNEIPQISEFEVYKKILSSKTPNSSLPYDIPKRIIKEFAVELTTPL